MNVSLEVCRVLASQHGLPLQFVVKEFHVLDVAQQIALVQGGKNLVFKGGTALNKVYLKKNQRFSEDLDFDHDSKSMDEVRKQCKVLATEIQGYQITEFRRVRDTIQFYCVFESPLGFSDHVRVDVAAKRVITSKPVEIRPISSEFTQQLASGLHVYALEDLIARKLHALRTRAEGKDVYDAFHALPLCGPLDKAIQCMLKTEEKTETVGEFLKETAEKVRKMDPKKLRNLTNPFIPTLYRPRDWQQLRDNLALELERRTEKKS